MNCLKGGNILIVVNDYFSCDMLFASYKEYDQELLI